MDLGHQVVLVVHLIGCLLNEFLISEHRNMGPLQTYLICFYYQFRVVIDSLCGCRFQDGFVDWLYAIGRRRVLGNWSDDLDTIRYGFLSKRLTQLRQWLRSHFGVDYQLGILRLILLLGTYLVDTCLMDFSPVTSAHIAHSVLVTWRQILD